ncbi:unnamed protein product [Clavelina lepadiformis]|uniref:Uncharacterized protein n=1 Tax=Clavelina lepadiformis TaxID=159417 RepID=A0ABP0F5X3_CLALP
MYIIALLLTFLTAFANLGSVSTQGWYTELEKQLQASHGIRLPDSMDPVINAGLLQKYGLPNINIQKTSLDISLLAGEKLPNCPVRVPICQRTRCARDIPEAETDAGVCLRDPRCCFDDDLLLHKRMLGDHYMDSAPVCYYGPTSKRYYDIASRIQPWNPFFQQTVVDLFVSGFNNTIDFKQAICSVSNRFTHTLIRQTVCGWIGITKLECRLKDCCFDDITGECNYPNLRLSKHTDIALSHPELIAESKEDMECSTDSEIKPSTFRRLPCLFPRTSDFNLTYTLQCQSSGCCRDFSPTVNRLTSVEGVTQELLFELQQKSPNLLAGINNDNLLAYLTLISGVQPRVSTYTNNYCPYKYFPFPGLPNLSNSVIGCCSHYICYHRKFKPVPSSVNSPVLARNANSESNLTPPRVQEVGSAWLSWNSWSTCSHSCGYGTQQRERHCAKHAPPREILPFTECDGLSKETQSCSKNCTHIAVKWSTWQGWEDCSASCGAGRQQRRRYCIYDSEPQAAADSRLCHGSPVEDSVCNGLSCPIWDKWSPFEACQASCGKPDTQTRHRLCVINGEEVNVDLCIGKSHESQTCFTKENCVVINEWGPWTDCSSTCEQGIQQRTRACFNSTIAPDQDCSFNITENRDCSRGPCPAKVINWDDWGSWEHCSASCGGGRTKRNRECVLVENSGVIVHRSLCATWLSDNQHEHHRTCNLRSCDSFHEWTPWSAYSTCSTSCGGGMTFSVRSCVGANGQVSPHNCLGASEKFRSCHQPACAFYTELASWGRCSKSCGVGIQIKTRCVMDESSSCLPNSMDFEARNCSLALTCSN